MQLSRQQVDISLTLLFIVSCMIWIMTLGFPGNIPDTGEQQAQEISSEETVVDTSQGQSFENYLKSIGQD